MPAEFIYTHVQARPALPAGPDGARGHLALVLPGRQDRRHRAERRRQVEPAADHGRARRRLHRRGAPDARASRVGYLSQEPQLDPAKDVKGNVMDGVRRGPGADRRSTTPSWPSGPTPTPTTRRSARSRPRSRTGSTRPTPGTSSATSRSRWTRCAARPTTPTSRRCPAARSAASRSCRLLLQPPRPAAARRADQPPRRRVGRVARALPPGVRGHRRRDHPRPLLPRQRRASGSSSSTAAGASRSRATTRAGSSRSWSAWRARRSRPDARQRTLARELEWVRMAPRARQAKGKARLGAYEKLLAEANDAKDADPRARDRDPARAAPRRPRSSRSRTCARATATGCSSRT